MRQPVNMRLPKDLLDRADAEAERRGQTRTKFVERALEAALTAPLIAESAPPKSQVSLRDTWAR